MHSLLERILIQKRSELAELRGRRRTSSYSPRSVQLRRPDRLALLTEYKLRSPSAGALNDTLTLEERLKCYAANGASMLSILCDSTFFGGSYEHLRRARAVVDCPLLCKEFIIDESQLDAAVDAGADAVLLIVRCLTQERLVKLMEACTDRELTPLVEVHTESEAERALDSGARLIGVNERDLDTLQMDRARAARVLASLPTEVTSLHLSGVKGPEDILRLKRQNIDGALIGEALMRLSDPAPLLRQLAAAASSESS